MRVPLSWLREILPGLPAGPDAADVVAAALVRAGLEVEGVERLGADVSGVVTARVLSVEPLTGFSKPVSFCRVDVGGREHGVVCGATNVVVDAVVPFATPGAVLPGDFRIASRTTYGRVSDGMICSAAELGLATDSDGILVLPAGTPLGRDVVELLDLRDDVLDVAVTPDRGYVLSLRGMAREAATAFGLPFGDPAQVAEGSVAPGARPAPAVHLPDAACDRYVARVVTGLDPATPSPDWMTARLQRCGVRPLGLLVDVTNYVMLELGQPLHAFDADALTGDIVVRRAVAGERLVTLDGQDRALDPGDLVIADASGPVALAGVMGGAATEVTSATTAIVLEGAHFDPVTVARAARRHKLPSEASRRFERGVDPALCAAAVDRAAGLLVELAGATVAGSTVAGSVPVPAPVTFPLAAPARLAGTSYAPDVVRRRLGDVGCTWTGEDPLLVTPPTWRPDLTGVAELCEEVIRLEGYDALPVVLPVAPAGRGLTPGQQARRAAGRALAGAGLLEVCPPPFVSARALEALGAREGAVELLNPLSDEEAFLAPTLLAGLLAAVQRNVARGLPDVALFQVSRVFGPPPVTARVSAPGVAGPPSVAERAALEAALPVQPWTAAVAFAGERVPGRAADWADAVQALLALGTALRVDLEVAAAAVDPFHPGRCAALVLDGVVLGHAGELHPRVVEALALPRRTCAGELDLDALVAAATAVGPVAAPVVSHYPPAGVDVALVVDDATPVAVLAASLRAGAGPLLESVRHFDAFRGPQVGEGKVSHAFALRFRAPDRTLVDTEVLAARDAAVARAGADHGAVLRGA